MPAQRPSKRLDLALSLIAALLVAALVVIALLILPFRNGGSIPCFARFRLCRLSAILYQKLFGDHPYGRVFAGNEAIRRYFGDIQTGLPFPVVVIVTFTEHNGSMIVVSPRRPQAFAGD